LSAFQGSLIPIAASVFFIVWFNFSRRVKFFAFLRQRGREGVAALGSHLPRMRTRNLFVDLTTGLRDFDLLVNLLKYFLLTLSFLAVIFLIFTAFELWKFAGTIDNGVVLLARYLFFLLPFIYLQLAPSAAMIGTLATYVIKSRQNEIVTWTSAGQSVYRLLLPCFVLMAVLGLANFELQEQILPPANQIQDELRSQIRSRGVVANRSGKVWVATDRRIYSFELRGAASDNEKALPTREVLPGKAASDNVKIGGDGPAVENKNVGAAENRTVASDNDQVSLQSGRVGGGADETEKGRPLSKKASASDNEQRVKNLTVYEFNDSGSKLTSVYNIPAAAWQRDRIVFRGPASRVDIAQGRATGSDVSNGELLEDSNPFIETGRKPSHMTLAETREQIRHSESDVERRNFAVALEKKYTTLFLPFIIALFTAPFALSLSRKGKVLTVGYAVGLWLMFMGVTNTFEQFGLSGSLSPAVAVWSPLFFFAMLGIYLLSKIRT
jgi:lipopolysaccharide export LptBFGC system permease protein LptF